MSPGRTAITIGTFDGVHVGHAALVRRAAQLAEPEGAQVLALAFDPHPLTKLRPDAAPARLTDWPRREALLLAAGADRVVRLAPTDELLGLSADDFVARLVAEHQPAWIVEGEGFRFGKGRGGDTDRLAALGRRHGFRVDIVPPVDAVLVDLTVVTASSTLVRWLLSCGRVADAACVLGRPHRVAGVVVRADRRGRTVGFPTANVAPADNDPTMLPADGVYAALAELPDGRRAPAAVNIGSRPTVGGFDRRVEAHLIGVGARGLDWQPIQGLPEYGWTLALDLLAWVRDQVRFASLDELTAQLARDVARVERLAGAAPPPTTPPIHTPRGATTS